MKPECKNALGLHDLGEYEYELELVQFEKVQEPWEMDDETKIDQVSAEINFQILDSQNLG